MKKGKPKVCYAASAGGHLVQLLRITRHLQGYDSFFVSTDEVVREKLSSKGAAFIIGQCNRLHPFKTFMVMLHCFKIVISQRPDFVVSTGAAPAFLICFAAKIFGAKIIWVDSIANVNRLSLSGRMVRPFADLMLTQWEHLAEKYEKVKFHGAVT